MRSHRFAVQTSVSSSGSPQAAVVGIAVTDDLCLIFDTLDTTRKARNLRKNQAIAFVTGGLAEGEECTIQYEGLADEPEGDELRLLKRIYFDKFPDGPERERWPGILYMRVRPAWIRYSNFSNTPLEIVEFNSDQLGRLFEDQEL